MGSIFISLLALFLVSAHWVDAASADIPKHLTENKELSRFKNFAALGDSYAAGIGAGDVLNGENDEKCSRYDGAYGNILKDKLSNKNLNFQFKACSGDLSKDVKKQAEELKDNSQDLVTVSAGGNDALLTDILKKCILFSSTEENCNKTISESRKVIDNELQGNVEALLKALDPKMKDGGIVLYTLYATFFNPETDECDDQSWDLMQGVVPGDNGLNLIKERRKRLNNLVQDANEKIKNAVAKVAKGAKRANIVPVPWDDRAVRMKGRFCEDNQKEEDALFFMANTKPGFVPPVKKSRRHNRREEDVHDIQKRVPDTIGRVFHPNRLGQRIIATRALIALFRETEVVKKPKKCEGKETPHDSQYNPISDPEPRCNKDWISGLLYNVFDGAYKEFCELVESKEFKFVEVTADATGKEKGPSFVIQDPGNRKGQKGKRSPTSPAFYAQDPPGRYRYQAEKRTPPPDPDAYDGLRINFEWRPKLGIHCPASCSEAFKAITASPCGHQGAQQNAMSVQGEADVGCGRYFYELYGPPGLVPSQPSEAD